MRFIAEWSGAGKADTAVHPCCWRTMDTYRSAECAVIPLMTMIITIMRMT